MILLRPPNSYYTYLKLKSYSICWGGGGRRWFRGKQLDYPSTRSSQYVASPVIVFSVTTTRRDSTSTTTFDTRPHDQNIQTMILPSRIKKS